MDEVDSVSLDSPERLRALSSPMRRAFVDTLSTMGPASVREIAARMGKSAATLYYHLRQLEDAGVVREIAERPTGKRPEKVYELVSDHFRVEAPPTDDAWRGEARRHIRDSLRTLERSLGAYLDDPRFGQDRSSPRFQFRAARIRLDADALRELSARFEELSRFLDEAERNAKPGTPSSEILFAYAPVHDHD
jgi:DNA-binding transcriptional ArsR family regulator